MSDSEINRQVWGFGKCVVIVAHPDDETLWAGGTILMHPESEWTVVTLCRKSDPDRSPKFFRALEQFNATGAMGNLDDGPEQTPLDERKTQNTIIQLLAEDRTLGCDSSHQKMVNGAKYRTLHTTKDEFDLIMTHGLQGEYTRHLRHEETAKSVLKLWQSGQLPAKEIWMFAYEDGGRKYLPKPVDNPDILVNLPGEIWQKKYDIITQIYGFEPDSFEAKTVPRQEAFRCFKKASMPKQAHKEFVLPPKGYEG
jgi:hypothetical protein